MKRASYRDAVDWVAQNDSPADDNSGDPEVCGSLVSAVLIADIFDVSTRKVGDDIAKRRKLLGLVKS